MKSSNYLKHLSVLINLWSALRICGCLNSKTGLPGLIGSHLPSAVWSNLHYVGTNNT